MDCSSFYSGKVTLLVAGKRQKIRVYVKNASFVITLPTLCIETGRWHRPIQKPITERICDACTI